MAQEKPVPAVTMTETCAGVIRWRRPTPTGITNFDDYFRASVFTRELGPCGTGKRGCPATY